MPIEQRRCRRKSGMLLELDKVEGYLGIQGIFLFYYITVLYNSHFYAYMIYLFIYFDEFCHRKQVGN